MNLEIVGIGTSPLMLLRATRLAERGHRVVLHERSDAVGGAWAAAGVLGFQNVETAVHLLENRPSLSRVLRQDLDLHLQPDPCVALLGRRILTMGPARVLFHGLIAAKAMWRGEGDKARRGLRSAARGLRHLRAPFLYPRGGAAEMTEALAAMFQRRGGEFLFGSSIRSVSIGNGEAECETTDGTVRIDRILVSSRAFVPVVIGGIPERLQIEHSISRSAVLHLANTTPARHAYVEVLGDRELKRVRDLGRIARPRSLPGEGLLAVQHRLPVDISDAELTERLLSALVRLRLIDRASRVLGLHRAEVAVSTLPDQALARLVRRCGGVIEGLRTTDLAEGFDRANRVVD